MNLPVVTHHSQANKLLESEEAGAWSATREPVRAAVGGFGRF
jgi:hypothetical protein